MGLAATLWAIIPLMAAIILEISHVEVRILEPYLDLNPFVQAGVVAAATARQGSLGDYMWAQGGLSSAVDATGWILLTAFVHLVVGVALAAWAGTRMRRNLV
jgi:hypothetical protein